MFGLCEKLCRIRKLIASKKCAKTFENHIYSCGTSFIDDIHKNPIAYVWENIYTTYYGMGFPDICVYCGTLTLLHPGVTDPNPHVEII